MRYKLNNRLTKDILLWILVSNILTLIGEYLYRGNLGKVFDFIKTYPYMFITNLTIILFLLSLAFLFRKRRFSLGIISFLIMLGYISNGIVSNFRGTPITWADFSSIRDAITISKNYLTISNIILAILGLGIAIVVFYFLWKLDKYLDSYKTIFIVSVGTILVSGSLMLGMWNYVNVNYPDHEVNWDLRINCENNGFLYSLINSKPEKKVAPENYNQDLISMALGEEATFSKNQNNIEVKPNIMMVQMESFLDISRLNGVTYDTNPLENYKKLHSENPHGFLGVPTFGGGTVRTEFEILTGLDIDYLPPGEIPNNSLMKTNTLETISHIVRAEGYESTIMHDYIGNFYDRDIVYANYGFETFVPYEYMKNVDYNGYYPADITNLQVISDLLDRNENQFIYSIGVEGHGPYDTQDRENTYGIKSHNLSNDDINQLNNYFDVISGEDKYVSELIKLVESKNEPTIIVFYSDHLPMLNVIDNDKVFDSESTAMSDYFIWNNFGLKADNINLEAYQMSTYLLDLLNIDRGLIPNFHRTSYNKDDYKTNLELLEYDVIYGNKYLYEGVDYIDKTNMKLGIYNIKINTVDIKNDEIIVKGENFTAKSQIDVDGTILETEFIDNNTLKAKYDKKINQVSVVQVGRHGKRLGECEKFNVSQ